MTNQHNIPNDIKAKVFAQYLGRIAVYNFGQSPLLGITRSMFHKQMPHEWITLFEDEQEEFVEDILLILKPLSAITDEDAIEVADLEGTNFTLDGYQVYSNSKIELVKETAIKNVKRLKAFSCDYLKSKGYDLPSWYLGGKTLHESNLCIYE